MVRIRAVLLQPVFPLRLGIYAALAVALTRTLSDPDLWGHLLFGRDILAAWSIPRVDPYSFTTDRVWIDHEWLAEIATWLSYSVGGPNGLIVLKVCLLLAALKVVSLALRRQEVPALTREVLLLIAAIGTLSRTLNVRPQLFSVLIFAALLNVLVKVDRGSLRSLLWLPPMFAVWANLHGGWIVGLGTLALWTTCGFISSTSPWSRRAALIVALAAALAGTAANPYGFELWRFLWETVGLGRSDISDWQPLYRVPELLAPWALSLSLAAFTLVRCGAPRNRAYLLIPAVLAVLSFRVARLDAFFCLSVIVFLSPQITRAWAQARPRETLGSLPNANAVFIAAVVVMLFILAPAGFFVTDNLSCVRMGQNDRWLPEPESTVFVQQNRLAGRMFTWFDYGEYAIWHLAPRIRVSIDGRRETVYSDRLIADHLKAYYSDAYTAPYVRELGADYAWLPNTLPAIRALKRSGWVPLFEGQRSVILSRSSHAGLQRSPRMPLIRCFPGP